MSLFFSLCCFSICFTPSLMLFKRLVVSDPLRIILFVLGAFFWLLSLLLTSLVGLLPDQYLLVAVYFSCVFQELARGLYYYLLYKAQGGLAKLADDGVDVTGVRLMFSSRHVLAIVCGLGMGVMAALILLTNILTDYSDDGVVGLPASARNSSHPLDLHVQEAYFPLYYSLACGLLTLFNVLWTVGLWDGLHKYFHKLNGQWYTSILVTLLSHLLNTTLSIWLRPHPTPVLGAQAVLFALTALHAGMLVKNVRTPAVFCRCFTSSSSSAEARDR